MLTYSMRERDPAAAGDDDDRIPTWWYARLVRRLATKGTRVLDFGCGSGALLRRLRPDFDVLGYDPAGAQRHRCRTNVPDALILEDWRTLPAESLDLVVSLRGLERAAQPLATLQALAGKLRPGGILLFAAANPGGLGRRLKGAGWFAGREAAQLRLPTQAEWRMLVRRAGFEVLAVCGDGLWDAPYVRGIPAAVQRVLLRGPAVLQLVWPLRRPCSVPTLGECLVVVSRKPLHAHA
jgi:SAM-dependent methyltransferase